MCALKGISSHKISLGLYQTQNRNVIAFGKAYVQQFETETNVTVENVKWELETRWELPSIHGTGQKTGRWKNLPLNW